MKKIKYLINKIGELWGLSLVVTLFLGIFTKFSIGYFFSLLTIGAAVVVIYDFFSFHINGGRNSKSNKIEHGNTDSSNNSGYAPYQGDRSMVGGVVGGSITPPVGGRAGQ